MVVRVCSPGSAVQNLDTSRSVAATALSAPYGHDPVHGLGITETHAATPEKDRRWPNSIRC